MSHDHPCETSTGVIKQPVVLDLEEGFKLLENSVVVFEDLLGVLALQAEQANSIGSVGLGLRILIRESVKENLHQLLKEGKCQQEIDSGNYGNLLEYIGCNPPPCI